MLAALALAALVLAAGTGGSSGRRGAVVLGVLSVVWVLVNEPMEGPVLVELTATHGVRSADLAALVGLGLAGYRGRNSWRSGREASASESTVPRAIRKPRPGGRAAAR